MWLSYAKDLNVLYITSGRRVFGELRAHNALSCVTPKGCGVLHASKIPDHVGSSRLRRSAEVRMQKHCSLFGCFGEKIWWSLWILCHWGCGSKRLRTKGCLKGWTHARIERNGAAASDARLSHINLIIMTREEEHLLSRSPHTSSESPLSTRQLSLGQEFAW